MRSDNVADLMVVQLASSLISTLRGIFKWDSYPAFLKTKTNARSM
jgi:hypothetical protein